MVNRELHDELSYIQYLSADDKKKFLQLWDSVKELSANSPRRLGSLIIGNTMDNINNQKDLGWIFQNHSPLFDEGIFIPASEFTGNYYVTENNVVVRSDANHKIIEI